jgi:hypothetical protein
MGLLGLGCLVALGLALERTVTAPPGTGLARAWHAGQVYLGTAWAMLLVAAALFYQQRATLLRLVGLLALALAGRPSRRASHEECLEQAGAWSLWWAYAAAWWWVITALVLIGVAAVSPAVPPLQSRTPTAAIACGMAGIALLGTLLAFVTGRRRDRDEEAAVDLDRQLDEG